ncbi:MAG TPA: hypothetical protein VJV79_01840 [Polyangiaceae bacterium]|nr:hypothetical protein [Polyangiaceae bacterium]
MSRFAQDLLGKAQLLLFASTLMACSATSNDPAETSEAQDQVSTATSYVSVAKNRPTSVPADYVVTPVGYLHPSCIAGMSESETLVNGKITGKNGSSRAVPKCAYPRYDRAGAIVETGATQRKTASAPAPIPYSGWVESANSADYGPLNWISANWKVPAAPPVDVGQTIYYFPGIQPIGSASTYTILQPVLGWNSGQWTIQSWNCCADGTAVNGPAAAVNAGDTIYGYVQGNVCTGGVCSQWQVYTGDWTNGRHSTLNTTAFGNQMGWAFAGALEVYGVSACNHYPATPSVTFSNIQVRNTNYQQISPVWNVGWTSDQPQCHYNVTASGTNTVTLTAY